MIKNKNGTPFPVLPQYILVVHLIGTTVFRRKSREVKALKNITIFDDNNDDQSVF